MGMNHVTCAKLYTRCLQHSASKKTSSP